MKRGHLLVVEGIDGTGKTGTVAKLDGFLREGPGSSRVVTSCEPTRGHYGMKAREVGMGNLKVTREEELDLYVRDREEHSRLLINPNLEAGNHVVIDRYYFSTVAYQSFDGHFTPEQLLAANEQRFQAPDLTIILDIPVALALARAKEREAAGGPAKSIYEQPEFLHHCREVFLAFAGYPDVAIVSAAGTKDEVWERVQRTVRKHLNF